MSDRLARIGVCRLSIYKSRITTKTVTLGVIKTATKREQKKADSSADFNILKCKNSEQNPKISKCKVTNKQQNKKLRQINMN